MNMMSTAVRAHEQMKDVLMDQTAEGPQEYYAMVRGGSDIGNITVLAAGTVGREYIKTYGHYHVDALPETYRILSGSGFMLLQKRREERIPGALAEFRIISCKEGDTVDIPAGYGHALVNVGRTFLVTVDDSPVNASGDSTSTPAHATYEPVREMRGFAYYVVEHRGAPAILRNARYAAIDKEELAGLFVMEE